MVDMPYNPTKPNHVYLIWMNKKGFGIKWTTMVDSHKIKPNNSSCLYFLNRDINIDNIHKWKERWILINIS